MTRHQSTATIIPIRDAAFREPTLEEMLSDPIVTAVMEADGVDPAALAALFGTIARALRVSSPAWRASA